MTELNRGGGSTMLNLHQQAQEKMAAKLAEQQKTEAKPAVENKPAEQPQDK